MVFRGGRPRRLPYPYDIVLNGTGLMLGQARRGAGLIAQKEADLNQVAPTTYEYASKGPFTEKTAQWERLTRGYGLRLQERYQDTRYFYALGADLSVGPWIKGPDITLVTPTTRDTTTGVTHFFELNGVLYALNGRYVLRRDGDLTWTAVRDFGAGLQATDVATFYSNARSAALAFVGLGEAAPAQVYDGTTWTAYSTLKATAWAVVGRDFYRAHDVNKMAKVSTDADPLNEANWTAANAFVIGDRTGAITRLAPTPGDSLFILKTTGIYTLDTAGQDHELFPQLRFAPDPDNGKGYGIFLNELYVPYGDALYRLDASGVLQAVGPDHQADAATPVRGRVTAFLGHGTLHAYAAIYNRDADQAFLLKLGGYEGGERLLVWHGSISPAFTGKKITALWKSTIGAPAGHSRLYLGFSDGSIGFFTLPCAPDPLACAAYRYLQSEAEVYLPLWHGTFTVDPKNLRAVTVVGDISSSQPVALDYKTDPTWPQWETLSTFTRSGQRVDFLAGATARLAVFRVRLQGSGGTGTPVVYGVALHHALRPSLVLEYQFAVLAEEGLRRRDGVPLRYGPDHIRQVVKGAYEGSGSVEMVLPDEQLKQLAVIDYGETVAWDDVTRRWRAALSVRAVELKTLQVLGTYGRLENYSYGQLRMFTYGQLEQL